MSAESDKAGKLVCPHCGHKGKTKVIDSRDAETGRRRRRVCLVCHQRFTTTERIVGDAEFWKVMEAAGVRGHLTRIASKAFKVL